jgi:hypothetical protein
MSKRLVATIPSPGLTKPVDFAEIHWNSAKSVRTELKKRVVTVHQIQIFEKS